MLNDMPTGAMTAPKLTVKRLKMGSGSIPGNPNPFPKIVEIILLLIQFSRSVMSNSVRPQRRQPTRPWGSPGKNTGVGCHFLLQIIV